MTIQRHESAHPTEIDLVAWIDEPEARATEIAAHVEACTACRARIRELEATRALLALDPEMPSGAAFAAQRERILAAIGERSDVARGGRVVGGLGWLVPLAAAAAIAVFVLVARDQEPRSPRTAGTSAEPVTAAGPVEESPLPLVARAREAAEEAAISLIPADDDAEAALVPAVAIDEDALDAALAAAEPLAPPVSVELSLTTESRFAELAEEDQDAVLLELAGADFDM